MPVVRVGVVRIEITDLQFETVTNNLKSRRDLNASDGVPGAVLIVKGNGLLYLVPELHADVPGSWPGEADRDVVYQGNIQIGFVSKWTVGIHTAAVCREEFV